MFVFIVINTKKWLLIDIQYLTVVVTDEANADSSSVVTDCVRSNVEPTGTFVYFSVAAHDETETMIVELFKPIVAFSSFASINKGSIAPQF